MSIDWKQLYVRSDTVINRNGCPYDTCLDEDKAKDWVASEIGSGRARMWRGCGAWVWRNICEWSGVSDEKDILSIQGVAMNKNSLGRALRILRVMREHGALNPDTMTDQELLRVRGLGRKVLPVLRELLGNSRAACPHCGLPVDMPDFANTGGRFNSCELDTVGGFKSRQPNGHGVSGACGSAGLQPSPVWANAGRT